MNCSDQLTTNEYEVIDLNPMLRSLTLDEYASIGRFSMFHIIIWTDDNIEPTIDGLSQETENDITECLQNELPISINSAIQHASKIREFALQSNWDILPHIEDILKQLAEHRYRGKKQTTLDSYFIK